MRPVGVTVALFLNSRTMAPNIGTLMIALESGLIQVWTHHPGAGFLEAFSAIHKYGDFVTSMATDPKNDFLRRKLREFISLIRRFCRSIQSLERGLNF